MVKNIQSYSNILKEIKDIINKARYNAFKALNTEMLKAYFEIGRKIVEEEQKGKKRAEYGKNLIKNLSKEIMQDFRKGDSVSQINMVSLL
jgi:translation initiation factor 2 alpha subunit (eIF-2alpha)